MKYILVLCSLYAVTFVKAQCDHTINLIDTWGDGWNGNEWTATNTSTGTVYGPYTILTGSSGSATFNVSPSPFGIYLNKIGCFCFEKQTLQPGEKKEFALTFFLDPKVVDDNKTKNMSDVTLSFTFFSSGYYEKSNT